MGLTSGPRAWEYQPRSLACPAPSCTERPGSVVKLRLHLKYDHRWDIYRIGALTRRLGVELGVFRPRDPAGTRPGTRLVLRAGKVSLSITLPKSWCESNRVVPGDRVRAELAPDGGLLVHLDRGTG